MRTNWFFTILLASVASASFLLSCSKTNDEEAMTADAVSAELFVEDAALAAKLMSFNPASPSTLDSAEITALTFIREEELMARDIYLAMKALWNLPVFNNISKSEQAHANAILFMLNKYQLPDPAAGHQPGIFSNQDIQTLYNALLAQGSQSLVDALYVGATIEDYDIYDIQHHLGNGIDNPDIVFVLNNLLKGSKNHMKAFYNHLKFRGVTYMAQYITQAELDAIVQ
ncbi:MAG TPA: DUF2202 domain-containing protein [Bacteroidales bacterium]|nr:DUF2202 domain-containing protein [Bacteroidales bacterium]HSA44407.1 DUF2202 domain-containing protein [Bacteroidales bacterium]